MMGLSIFLLPTIFAGMALLLFYTAKSPVTSGRNQDVRKVRRLASLILSFYMFGGSIYAFWGSFGEYFRERRQIAFQSAY
jgi:hypothetical protein